MRTPRIRNTSFNPGLGHPLPLRDAAPRVDDRPPEPIDPSHRDLVAQGLEDVRRGDIATAEEVTAAFAHFRR